MITCSKKNIHTQNRKIIHNSAFKVIGLVLQKKKMLALPYLICTKHYGWFFFGGGGYLYILKGIPSIPKKEKDFREHCIKLISRCYIKGLWYPTNTQVPDSIIFQTISLKRGWQTCKKKNTITCLWINSKQLINCFLIWPKIINKLSEVRWTSLIKEK